MFIRSSPDFTMELPERWWVAGWRRNRHRSGPSHTTTTRIHRAQRGLTNGHQRILLHGHQWGLSHGHGHHDRGHHLVVHHEVGFDPQCRSNPTVSVDTTRLGMHRSDRITEQQSADRPVGGRSHPGAIGKGWGLLHGLPGESSSRAR